MSLLISKEKWRKFSTLNKYFLIAAIVGILVGLFTIYTYTFPKIAAPSPSELVIKDENPVNLEIADISIKKWLGDSEPYITINIKNSSKRTAVGVIAKFQGEKDLWQFTPTKTATQFQNGVSIPSESSLEFPVAPVSEFLSKFPNSQNLHIIGLGINPNMPMSFTQKECKNLNPCFLNTEAKPFGFNLNYKNIFNEPVHQFFSIFTYFSSKNIAANSPINITIIEPQTSRAD